MSVILRPALALVALCASFAGCGEKREKVYLLPPSSEAQRLLAPTPWARLLVEVDYVESHPPSQTALALLETRLNDRLNKPGGITIVVDDAIPPVVGPTSPAQLTALEQQHRDYGAEGDLAVIYVVYVNGASTYDTSVSKVLGQAYGPLSFGVFRQNIDEAASELVSPLEIERATLVHELGHLIGLVNLGTPMVEDHVDPENLAHDINPFCVMHHQIETTNVQFLIENGGQPPDDFGAQCVADLRANGGK